MRQVDGGNINFPNVFFVKLYLVVFQLTMIHDINSACCKQHVTCWDLLGVANRKKGPKKNFIIIFFTQRDTISKFSRLLNFEV